VAIEVVAVVALVIVVVIVVVAILAVAAIVAIGDRALITGVAAQIGAERLSLGAMVANSRIISFN